MISHSKLLVLPPYFFSIPNFSFFLHTSSPPSCCFYLFPKLPNSSCCLYHLFFFSLFFMAYSSHNNFDELEDENFDQHFDQYFDQTFDNILTNFGDQQEERRRRKKWVYIERNREAGNVRLWNDYFSETPTNSDNLFRRRFRMNKPLFMKIVDRLSNEMEFFQQKKMVSEDLVSLHFKNVQQLFVSWHMVMRLMRLTNTSNSVQLLLGHCRT